MKPSVPKFEDPQSQLDAPPRPELRWIRCCLILFLFSFALDFHPDGGTLTMAGPLSFAPFGIALASGGFAFLMGLRHLLVRPGAYLILLWFGFLALTTAAGILRGNDTAQILRALQLPILSGLAITTTHAAACSGMRAGEAVRYFLIASVVGLLWRFGLGFQAHRLEVFEMRPDLLSPAFGFLIALATCALLLRRSDSRLALAAFGVTAALAVLGILRGLSFPILFPAAGSAICLALGMKWRLFPRKELWKKIAPIGLLVLLGIVQISLNGLNPQFGAAIPPEGETSFPGLFSSTGLLGISVVFGMMAFAMGASLRSAWRNSETVMGRWARDVLLMFLPFVAMVGLLGESLVRNPFHEPFSAVLFGFLAAMPQFFFNRAFYLRHRENEAAITPQLILNEEDLPTTWEGAFPSNA